MLKLQQKLKSDTRSLLTEEVNETALIASSHKRLRCIDHT